MTKFVIAFVLTVLLAVFYGVIFSYIYPLVVIDTGLALGFALAGIITYAALRLIVLGVKTIRFQKK
jgi:hypothetical protein